MRELLRVVEDPRPCPYLPAAQASLEYRVIVDLDAASYAALLARGYRRFGYQLYRPACGVCSSCVSLRVLARDFVPTRGQRRVLRQNRHIRVEKKRTFVTAQHIGLFNRYHGFMRRHRGWDRDCITNEDYAESFLLGGGGFSWQWLYYDGADLVGVALMDEVRDAISLVYYFHEPSWRPLSPGTFSVLTQLAYARERNVRFAYPGYWVEANTSMNYKVRYHPHEVLTRYPADAEEPVWKAPRTTTAVLA